MLKTLNVEYVAALIAIIGAIVGGILWGLGAWNRRLAIHRVTRPDEEILEAGFDLYEDRLLAPNVRDNPADFRRWLEENREAHKAGNFDVTILFYIATQNEEARAFFYAEYYHRAHLLLVSYLVTHKSKAGKRAGIGIMRRLKWRLRYIGCRRVVFELEEPSSSRDRHGRRSGVDSSNSRNGMLYTSYALIFLMYNQSFHFGNLAT